MVVRERRRCGARTWPSTRFPFFLGETLAARVTAKVFTGREGVVGRPALHRREDGQPPPHARRPDRIRPALPGVH